MRVKEEHLNEESVFSLFYVMTSSENADNQKSHHMSKFCSVKIISSKKIF